MQREKKNNTTTFSCAQFCNQQPHHIWWVHLQIQLFKAREREHEQHESSNPLWEWVVWVWGGSRCRVSVIMPTFFSSFTFSSHQFWPQQHTTTLQTHLPKTPNISPKSEKTKLTAAVVVAATTNEEAFLPFPSSLLCSLVLQLCPFWVWCWYWLPTHGGSSCGVWSGFHRESFPCGD